MNNTTMGSINRSVKRNGNSSVRQPSHSQSVSSPATTSKASVSLPPVSKTNSFCSCLGWVFVCALAMLVYAVTMEGGSEHMLQTTTDQQTADHWKEIKDVFKADLRTLSARFPNQSSSTWTMISATLKSSMNTLPDYPGVLVLLSTP